MTKYTNDAFRDMLCEKYTENTSSILKAQNHANFSKKLGVALTLATIGLGAPTIAVSVAVMSGLLTFAFGQQAKIFEDHGEYLSKTMNQHDINPY